jgi:hypothetical protein
MNYQQLDLLSFSDISSYNIYDVSSVDLDLPPICKRHLKIMVQEFTLQDRLIRNLTIAQALTIKDAR